MRILSGMQPSGKAHLGNYLGAMKQHVSLQEKNDCFFFLANYHALTTVRNPKLLKQMTFELAADYLALGINPEKTVFFRQSDVPEHTELAWILSCMAPMGLLERAHAWKDAKAKGKKDATVGLFNYPILMAVDILMYSPDKVPVGKDQSQHIEIARDLASSFNHLFGETFHLPEADIKEDVAIIPGTDGEKMSKSYGNTIDIFAPEKELASQVMSIKTDSTPLKEPKDHTTCTVFHLYSLLATAPETSLLKQRYEEGNFGYGEAKKLLLEKILEEMRFFREKREKIAQNPSHVEEVLRKGAIKAREVASKKTEEVRKKVGIH